MSSLVVVFFKIISSKKKCIQNTIRGSNSLDPDQARRYVGPDLGPKCLHRLSADDTSHFELIKPMLTSRRTTVDLYYFIFWHSLIFLFTNVKLRVHID